MYKLQSQNQRNAVIYPNIKAKVIQESFLFYSVTRNTVFATCTSGMQISKIID
jgi:hypothetical protein